MLRQISGLLIALLFLAGLVFAGQGTKSPKKGDKKVDFTTVIGFFESYKDEILTLKVDDKEKKFKVPGDTQVGYSTGKEDKTTILEAKEHLKDVQKGSTVAVTLDGEGKKVLALGVVVPELPKGKSKGEQKKEK
jgi:hypothetical protein